MGRLDGKVAIITGAAVGIGRATARLFAREGAVVAVTDVKEPECIALAQEIAAGGGKAHAWRLDVAREDEVRAVTAAVAALYGGLDVLVNNAGILKDRTLRKMTLDEWTAVLETNLTGVFHACKFGAEVLRDGGRIVNVASVAGLVGFPGQANYAAAKAGVIGLTRSIAKELCRRQITVNAVAPGIVETQMMRDIKPEMRAEYVKQIPLGRFAQPADVANAILFLASAESGYITGQVLPVTGGWV